MAGRTGLLRRALALSACALALWGADAARGAEPDPVAAVPEGAGPARPIAQVAASAAPAGPTVPAAASALTALVARTPVRDLPALVASDPRFVALDGGARLLLLDSASDPPLLRVAASALNFWPSLGVGSLVQGDLKGAATVAGGEAIGVLLLFAAGAAQDGGAIGAPSALLVAAGVGVLAGSLAYGVVRPWHFEGRRRRVLREQLFPTQGVAARPVPATAAAPPPSGATLAVAFRF